MKILRTDIKVGLDHKSMDTSHFQLDCTLRWQEKLDEMMLSKFFQTSVDAILNFNMLP